MSTPTTPMLTGAPYSTYQLGANGCNRRSMCTTPPCRCPTKETMWGHSCQPSAPRALAADDEPVLAVLAVHRAHDDVPVRDAVRCSVEYVVESSSGRGRLFRRLPEATSRKSRPVISRVGQWFKLNLLEVPSSRDAVQDPREFFRARPSRRNLTISSRLTTSWGICEYSRPTH